MPESTPIMTRSGAAHPHFAGPACLQSTTQRAVLPIGTLSFRRLVAEDLEGIESTVYRFNINSVEPESWNAGAEPAQYGRTGKLSFYMGCRRRAQRRQKWQAINALKQAPARI